MAENTLQLSLKKSEQYGKLPKIVVMGIGGGGCNAINNMVNKKIDGVEFVVANTDLQALSLSKADRVIQLGKTITKGQGAGSFPEVGIAAAEEAREEIEELLKDTQLLFLTAGMGGGTGTGATPVIAKIAREKDILTVAVVTKPFQYEAELRLQLAEQGIAELRKYVDTMIILPNENLFRIANKETTLKDAFSASDNVLYLGIRGITDLITTPGLINLDFADVRMVIKKMGRAMMGMGEAEGENRATKAVKEALSNPLLEDVNIKGATGALINITGSPDITLFEFDEAAKMIREEIGGDKAIIKVGTAFMKELEGKVRVSIFATGMPETNTPLSQSTQETPIVTESPKKEVQNIFHAKDTKEPNTSVLSENEKVSIISTPKITEKEENNKTPKVGFGKTRLTASRSEEFFDMGKPVVEEEIEQEEKKPGNSFFAFLDSLGSKKKNKESNEVIFKSKNREIEFKSNTISDDVDEQLLNIPAYLRNKKN